VSNLNLHPGSFVFGLAVPLLFISLQTCVSLDARPESDQNPVGAAHTVTADVEADSDEDWALLFEVIEGPNEGENSLCEDPDDFLSCEEDIADCLMSQQLDEDIDECLAEASCDPGCAGSGDETVQWTFRSNGESGTDVIVVCGLVTSLQPRSLGVGIQQIRGDEDEDIDELIEEFEEAGCDVLFKDWVTDDDEDERVTNPGGVFAGDVGAAQRNRERARASVAAAATPRPAEASVRPPSTGDAGLRY
jgi:hypothetical protein